MKKIFLLSVLISLLFLFTESKSQDITCPPGWYSGTTSGSIVNPSNNELVEFDIFYCWTIDANGNITIKLKLLVVWDKYKLQGMEINTPEFWNLINELMMQDVVVNHSNVAILPCPSSTNIISIQRVNCWHYQDLDFPFLTANGYSNPNMSYLGISPCNIWGAYCEHSFSLCWDYSYTPPKLKITSSSSVPPIQIECPNTIDPYDPNAPMSTECFSICN